MNDIVNQVAERTGLPPDKARMAVETVVNALKSRLPAPIAQQLDGVLAGGGAGGAGGGAGGAGGLGGLAGGLGGMLGGDRK